MPLRDPTAEEVSQLIDEGAILNEPGANLLTRWLAKTFSANPEEAKGFLERQGFTVQPVPGLKLQFIIQNPAVTAGLINEKDSPPKLLDPEGFEFADIVDIAFDVFVAGPVIGSFVAGGALVGAAGGPLAPLGIPLGTAVGSAVGGAGIEATRQLIGTGLGVNRQTDFDSVLTAGMLSAILPGIAQRVARFPQALLKFSKFTAKKAALIGRNIAARVAGTGEEAITTAAKSEARTATIASESAARPIELLDRIRGKIRQLRLPENRFPESREIDSLLEKARPIPLAGLFKILGQKNVQPIGTQKIGVFSARRIGKQIAHRLGFRSVEEAARARISAQQAQEIKQILQGQIDFSGRPGEKFLNKILKSAQGNLGSRIKASLPTSQARSQYKTLDGFGFFTDNAGRFHPGKGVVGKTEALNDVNKKVGEHLKAGTAEKFLQAITGEGRTQEQRLVKQFDDLFGQNFLEEGLMTRLALPFSRDAPKLTAFGKFIGPGVGATVGGGIGSMAGPEGAFFGTGVGAIGGFIAGAPKGMLKTSRAITRIEELALKGVGRAGRALRRAEPLQDFLARSGGGAVANITARERRVQPNITALPPTPKGAQIDESILKLIDEVNALPNLSGDQRMAEFERRVKILRGQQ
ncbi:MAG: hypothetical protein ACE5JX_19195 [Acidobacteriota bacterium]